MNKKVKLRPMDRYFLECNSLRINSNFYVNLYKLLKLAMCQTVAEKKLKYPAK